MICSFQVYRIAQRKILRFECENCNHPSSPHSQTCLTGIVRALIEHPDSYELVLPGPLDHIYTGESLLSLKRLALAFERCRILALTKPSGCGKCWQERSRELNRIIELIPVKPQLALTELRRRKKVESTEPACKKCLEDFSKTLETMQQTLEECLPPKGTGLLPPLSKPSFSYSQLSLDPPQGKLVDGYQVGNAEVRIYQLPNLGYFYFLIPPEFSLSAEKASLLAEVKQSLLSERIEDPLPSREQLRRKIESLLLIFSAQKGILLNDELSILTSILLRHTIGLGLLELLLEDPWVQDVYVDAPLGSTPVYLYHRKYEECVTNLYLTPMDAEPLVSKFRALSGRPFSESNPVVELEWENTRVTVVGKPLSPQGVSFSFRRHRTTPWTLPQFIAVGLLPPVAASFLSLAVDAQSCILITGSRGSGKTSLLGSLLLELHPKLRIVVVEDTPELPVDKLRELGYKIQTLQTKSPLSSLEGGISAEDALRTVLRMGESVLVLGEVRGPEAKVLFEAMRIGAVGNSVLGTLHGSSSRDVLERITQDLGIAASSFKSTDLIVCLGPVRERGFLTRRRKLLQLTELRKFPQLELQDLVVYHPQRGDFIISLEKSYFLKKVSRLWGMKTEELRRLIELKAKVFQTLVEISKRAGPKILEADFVLQSNLMLRSFLEKESENAFEEWHHWLVGAIHER